MIPRLRSGILEERSDRGPCPRRRGHESSRLDSVVGVVAQIFEGEGK